jgi:hypothetical protein
LLVIYIYRNRISKDITNQSRLSDSGSKSIERLNYPVRSSLRESY